METTKKHSPFTHFDLDYYNNLRLLDTSKAEAYRKKMTAPLQASRNLSHEKYADQMLNKEIAKDILFIKKYAEKNKISQEQAIIDIRQSFIESLDKNKEYRQTEEEVKNMLLHDGNDTTPVDDDWLEGAVDDDKDLSDDDKDDTNIDQDNTKINGTTNKADPYADVSKKQLLGEIKAIAPETPVNDRTNKETLVKTYEELLAIKNEETK